MMNADDILKRFDQLVSQRGEWDGRWQQCSDFVLPRMGADNRKNQLIFDSTATLALSRFAAAMESITVPRTQKWHGLVTGFPELDRDPEIVRWLEAVNNIIFSFRYAPEANFANQMTTNFFGLGLSGTGTIFVDENRERAGLRYKYIPVRETYIAEDYFGRIDTVYRWYRLTARQAYEQFGDECPEQLISDLGRPETMDREYEFVHGVFPRKDFKPGMIGNQGFPLASVHIARQSRKIVRESGYRTMPYAVARFWVSENEVYGRSPAMDVMSAITQVNAMKETVTKIGQKIASPPLLAADADDVLAACSLKPAALNFGGLDDQGRPRIVPLQISGNIPVTRDLIEDERAAINEAFYLTLFQVLVEQPSNQTATAVIQKASEQAQLLAPVMGRIQSEQLWSIVNREVDILSEAGAFPPMPDRLAEALEGGAGINPKYETTMAQALSSRDGQAVLRALEGVTPMAGIDPTIMQMIDAEKAARIVWEAMGAPAGVLRSEEEVAELRAQAAQQAAETQGMAQAGAALQGLESLSNAEKNLAQAAGTAGTAMEGMIGNA